LFIQKILALCFDMFFQLRLLDLLLPIMSQNNLNSFYFMTNGRLSIIYYKCICIAYSRFKYIINFETILAKLSLISWANILSF